MEFTYELLIESKRPKDKTRAFDEFCQANGIEHRLTLFRHPWTNGQVERMNRKIKDNTTKKFHYQSVEELKTHLYHCLLDYNFHTPLKILGLKIPFDRVQQEYPENSTIFLMNPDRFILGQNK